MASATQDLPDPLDDRRSTAPASPDDLLSQMADDAIDKLIAEADAHDGPPAPPLPVSDFEPVAFPAPSHPEAAALASAEVAALSAPLETAHDASPPPAEVAPSASLESVLNAADATPAPVPPAAAEAATPPPAAVPVPPPAPAPHAEAHPPVMEPTTSADVKALLADDPHMASEKSSILLLPLQVLSAPLTHVDDRIRNAVGQVAIVTLLNAIAVLIYVLVVRHK